MSAGTVDGAIARARAAAVERLDAQLLLAAVLGKSRSWVLAHGEAVLDLAAATRFDALCARRAEGEPLAYLLGAKEFHGLALAVDPRVLVPRPDTELLVDWALELLAVRPPGATVADLGTGSGAIALALAHARPGVRMCAVDLSADALAVARGNGARLGVDVEWLHGDWWMPLAGRRFDLLLANPPYVADDDPHLTALRHEPIAALTAGADGLDALRVLARGAAAHLQPGGWLLLEHGAGQDSAVRELLRAGGLTDLSTRTDLAALPRCSGGRFVGQAFPV